MRPVTDMERCGGRNTGMKDFFKELMIGVVVLTLGMGAVSTQALACDGNPISGALIPDYHVVDIGQTPVWPEGVLDVRPIDPVVRESWEYGPGMPVAVPYEDCWGECEVCARMHQS